MLNHRKVPTFIKNRIQSWGLTFFYNLYSARHTRLQLYPIRVSKNVRMELWLDWQDYTDAGYIFHQVWELPNTNFILRTLTPGDVAIDIGANIGFFTILMSLLVDRSTVLSVEPMKRNLYVLNKNIQQNKLSNVVIAPFAVDLHEDEINVIYRYLNSGSPSTVGFLGEKDPIVDIYILNETVKTRTVESLFRENDIVHCKLLKMDIQGAEYDVLDSMSTLLKNKQIDYLLVENSPSAHKDKSLSTLMQSFGYRPYKILQNGTLEKCLEDPLPKGDFVFSHLDK